MFDDSVVTPSVEAKKVKHSYKPFEISTPSHPPLKGYLYAGIFEGDYPSNNVIRTDQEWSVRLHWWLEGALRECICGYWCLNVHFESMGGGPEFSWPYEPVKIALDPCGDGHYKYDFKFLPGLIKPQHCSVPYKLVVTLQYETPCYRPGPMAGFCELPMVQFYDSAK